MKFQSKNYDDATTTVAAHVSVRTQVDGLGDIYSKTSALDCSADRDMTRQEFREESDINVLLKKFGLNQQSRPLVYGEFDYTIDYQQALTSLEAAGRAHARMPAEVREKYPTTRAMLDGMASGELAKELENLSITKQAAAAHAELEKEIEKESNKTRILRERQAAIMAERFKTDPEQFETKTRREPKESDQR